MKRSDLAVFCCPACKKAISFSAVSRVADKTGQELSDGELVCNSCNHRYPVRGGIPRFVPDSDYADSFSFQWKIFHRLLQGRNQKEGGRVRFDIASEWPVALDDQNVLEVGCGSGLFTQIVIERGCQLYSFDLSDAVDVAVHNLASNPLRANLHPFQANLYHIPLPEGMFDKVYCLGVLQHCPDVKKAFMSLLPFVKSGGELVVDCYQRNPQRDWLNLKYIVRSCVWWMNKKQLYWFCKTTISIGYEVKLFFSRIPVVGKHLADLIPIGALHYEPEYVFTKAELKENKVLSMFDMLSPAYDKPQDLKTVEAWAYEAGLVILSLTVGFNGINMRCRRP